MWESRFGEGPYHLTVRSLACNVGRNGPAAFLLGEQTEDGFVAYAGRSDTGVSARLQRQIGKYRQFLFAYTATAEAAFKYQLARVVSVPKSTIEGAAGQSLNVCTLK